MATSSHYDANVDFTVCPVCLDKFQTPRSLPCSHTFCHRCLSAHIESSCQDSDPAFGFPCPVCRVFVPAPGILRQYPTQDWASRFPENSFLSTCIRKQVSPSDTTCGPCEILGEHGIKADSWCVECEDSVCEKCVQRHKMFKALLSHQILPISNNGTDIFKDLEKIQNYFEICEKHEDRTIEHVCNDHQKGCCSVCIIKEHKHCREFSTIAEAADTGSDEIKLNLVREFEQLLSKVDKIILKVKQNIADIDEKMDTYSEKIRNMIEEMVSQLKSLEDKYINQLAEISKNVRKNLEESLSSYEHRRMYIAHWFETVSTDTRKLTREELVMKCLKTNEVLKAVDSLPLIQLSIGLSAQMSNGKEKIESLGTLFCAKTTENNVNFNNIQHAEITEITEFDIKHSRVFGGGFLPNGQLLLCDNSLEKCIVYGDDGSIVQEVPLPGAPWDAFFESDGRILITIPNKNTIVVLQRNTLAIEKTLPLSCECRGIAKWQDKYLIGTRGKIEEYSTDLAYLTSRSLNITDDIAVDNDGCIVYGNYNNSTIIKEDINHEVIFTYKHKKLVNTCGVAFDNHGFIFVNGRQSNNIHILSADGNLLKIIDINEPQCIKFEKNSRRMFVVNSKGIVKIFQIMW